MDAMAIAQMKRQMFVQEEELRHNSHDLQVAELALEANKKKVDELHKKVTENKRKLDLFKVDLAKAEDASRRAAMEERRRG
jgi:hypothetical protein